MYFKKYSWQIGLLTIALLILLSLPFQYKIEQSRNDFDIIEQSLYLSSSALKKMSLGYELIIADIYWIRALQYFTNTKNYYGKSEKLYKYFDIITDLDPKFVNAYRFGGSFLAEKHPIGLYEIELGTKLFEKGRKNNPDNFRLIIEEAFVYYLYTNDYKKASDLFNEASEKVTSENRKASLKGMAALALSKSGNLELSEKIWNYIYRTSTNEARKKFALSNIIELRTKQIEIKLSNALKRFYADHNIIPDTLTDLLDKEYINQIPSDPTGGEFVIIENIVAVKSDKLTKTKYNDAVRMLNAKSYRFRRITGRYADNLEELRTFIEQTPLHDYPEHPYGKSFVYDPTSGKIK
jgi:tetratricopeptide (TPR) repeat protein